MLLGCVMPRGDSDGDMELNKPALTIREIMALPLPSEQAVANAQQSDGDVDGDGAGSGAGAGAGSTFSSLGDASAGGDDPTSMHSTHVEHAVQTATQPLVDLLVATRSVSMRATVMYTLARMGHCEVTARYASSLARARLCFVCGCSAHRRVA